MSRTDRPLLTLPADWSVRSDRGFRIHSDAARGVDPKLGFAFAVARGLESSPRTLDFRYLYDRAGSEIFDRITEQPEYYQTRTEDRILAENADAIRRHVGDVTIVEIGSGSSTKTQRLLEAWGRRGPSRYIPIDISPAALETACGHLARTYPWLTVEGIVASYDRGLPMIGHASPLMLVFLGSSIGNFDRAEHESFLETVASRLAPNDYFLIGIDLVKDPARIEAAYNDAADESGRFTRNLFERMNRELGAAVPIDAVEHVAYYDDRMDRVEIYARFRREVMIELPLIERRYRIAAGEMIRTEISSKYRVEVFAATAARYGFSVERVDKDSESLFATVLLRRIAGDGPPDQRAELEAILRRVRLRTHEIISPLSDEELEIQPDPLMGPLAWDLCHIARYEERWLVTREGGPGGEGLDPTFDPLLTPRAVRGQVNFPDRSGIAQLLSDVRRAALERLRAGELTPELVQLVVQHEAQHQETMLQALHLREAWYAPPFRAAAPPNPRQRPAGDAILVPEGPFTVGTDDGRESYDNERPRHDAWLPAYRIDASPVTNGQFLAFMEDGGYQRRDLWSEDGWRWRQEHDPRAPGHWRRDEVAGGTWRVRNFGRLDLIDLDRPVVHVCFFEAEAWARWAGKRLPTEEEWEKAASWDPELGEARLYPWGSAPPTAELANLDQRLLEPMPIGSYPRGRSFYACHQMIGDVWEWTSSFFQPYPGFVAHPYREYSEIFFGEGYRVLRGGSWATSALAIRNTFRNWDYPQRRQIFAGFRCVQ